MKVNRTVIFSFLLFLTSASLYRVWEGRPWGFAPQIAMALFAGAIVKDKKWAFIIPVLSMFLSDALYQVLYINGLTEISGFYSGQMVNYILFGSLTVFGILIRKINVGSVLAASLGAPTVYFLISNFLVWVGGGGYQHAKTFNGLLLCYNDGLPFYRGSLEATVLFSSLFFGTFLLAERYLFARKQLA